MEKEKSAAPLRGSAVSNVYQILYERIVGGVYPPGLRLSQKDLSDEFSTSRTPLREAMNRLQATGLVVANRNRGMVVAPICDDKTEQWYALRLMVEPTIVASLVDKFTDEDLSAMAQALDAMRVNTERTLAYQRAHFDFHNVALQLYPIAFREMVEEIYVNIARSQSRHFTRPHVAEAFIDVDGMMLEAFRSRDPELARRILEFHLLDAALGMIRDIDPDKVPVTLLIAARGIGMEVDGAAEGPLPRPTPMRWTRPAPIDMPALRTSNLEFRPRG
ncbi:MAG: GntR family transcriptional regulator [Burkholderiaceae bacterium]|nr:GntR family transcriptional regulator [Burkholderiaceae bacterium]